MILCPNTFAEPETQGAQKIFRVISGRVSIELKPSERKGVSTARTELDINEIMFIPAELEHRLLNFESEPAKILFAVAGGYA